MFRVFILWDADLRLCSNRDFVLNKMLPEMKELINTFEPHVLWSDGDWEAYPEYFGSKDFLAWLYNQSPVKDVVVTNDRPGAVKSRILLRIMLNFFQKNYEKILSNWKLVLSLFRPKIL